MSGMVDGIQPRPLGNTLVGSSPLRAFERPARRPTPRPLRRARPLAMAAMPMDGLRRQLLMPTPQLPAWETTAASVAMAPAIPSQIPETKPSIRPALWAIPLAAVIVIPTVLIMNARWHKPVAAAADAVQVIDTASAKAAAQASPTTPAPSRIDATALQARIDQIASAAGPVNLYVSDLGGTAISSHNADTKLLSASLYKLFAAYTIYSRIDSGQLSLSSPVTGTTYDINTCLNRMITFSDNECGVALGNMLKWGSANSTLKTAGFTNTDLASPQQTTPRDVGHLLEQLYRGTLLAPTSNQHFLGLLKAQQINNRIPAALPAGTAVAHKTGDLNGFVHDAGIVYSPKGDYIVVEMSGSWNNLANAAPNLATASRQIYDFINQ